MVKRILRRNYAGLGSRSLRVCDFIVTAFLRKSVMVQMGMVMLVGWVEGRIWIRGEVMSFR